MQHDFVLENNTGAAFRADCNSVLAAIVSNNSGASAPSTTYAYQFWVDTTSSPKLLKIRNAANSAWITIGSIESANFAMLPLEGGTMTGAFLAAALLNLATCDVAFTGDANTGLSWISSDVFALVSGGNEILRIKADPEFKNSTAVKLPVGSTAARPGSPVSGQFRYNSDNNEFEGYLASSWDALLTRAASNLISAKSADYTVTDTDKISTIVMTTSSTNRTVTFPTAADNVNRIITLKKVDTGTGQLIADGEGGELIDGALTYIMYFVGESATFQCDGSAWHILDQKESKWVAWTPTYVNSSGNAATTTARVRKLGKKIECTVYGTWSGAGAAANFAVTPPIAVGASVDLVASGYGTFERGGATAERPFVSRLSGGNFLFWEAGSTSAIQGSAFSNLDVHHMYFHYEID